MVFVDDNPNDLWKLKSVVLDKINIVDIVKEYGLEPEGRTAGQFTHRMSCPFHKGKEGGTERTPSLFLSGITNSFHCFSCLTSGDPITFISLMEGTPPILALKKLALKSGVLGVDGQFDMELIKDVNFEQEAIKPIDPMLIKINVLVRNYIKKFRGTKNYVKELKWAEKVGLKIDELLISIDFEDWDYVNDLYNVISSTIEKRLRSKI